ncbi:MAG: sigma-70 family RNA polymerase sigma factor [Acidimicrobiales bacterium]|nr:sigma-70 family RNA polymerase sigma factor [Acidimicrobiales bacterium]HRW38234.1 sigma-70 family RNA polymerase sigma factor [Aquihabitans sp.]
MSSEATVGVPADPPRAADGFDAFYRAMAPRLVVLGRAITGSTAVAEEVAQEALFVAHRRWTKVATLDRPDLWVRRVAANRCISIWRRRAVEHRANQRYERSAGTAVPDPAAELGDDALWAEVRRLPQRQAAALTMHYVDQLTTAEIAAVLGCRSSTVQTHLARGRATLAERLSAHEEDPRRG